MLTILSSMFPIVSRSDPKNICGVSQGDSGLPPAGSPRKAPLGVSGIQWQDQHYVPPPDLNDHEGSILQKALKKQMAELVRQSKQAQWAENEEDLPSCSEAESSEPGKQRHPRRASSDLANQIEVSIECSNLIPPESHQRDFTLQRCAWPLGSVWALLSVPCGSGQLFCQQVQNASCWQIVPRRGSGFLVTCL